MTLIPPSPTTQRLVDIVWDGLPLMALSDTLDCIVQNVEGWYDTAPVDGHNVNRDLFDGALYGPKVFNGREITISGTALGERAPLIAFRDAIAQRVARNDPTEITISDPWLGLELMATVRASDQYKHTFNGPAAFTYQVVLLAADPRRYSTQWQTATLSFAEGGTGRLYPRTYPWRYQSPIVPESADLWNGGDADTPVYAVYNGPLSQTRLSDGMNAIILSSVGDGVQILVNTQTLLAQAPGGASRTNYILPGSTALAVPAHSTQRWHVYGTGLGNVVLNWRAAYV